MENAEYDVAVVGASFAGLAVAMQLREHRVLLIDQRPVGSHQTSTCATPLSLVRALRAEHAVQEVHRWASIHAAGRELRYRLQEPYVTFDYYLLCQAMLSQTNAEVRLARAGGYSDGVVHTNQGPVRARFAVDASGWQSLRRHNSDHRRFRHGYGIETEVPVRLPVRAGLHCYFEKNLVRNGYAWVFPCGDSTRAGVCTFDTGVRLRPALEAFLDRFGLRCGKVRGGGMVVTRRQPLDGDVFVVGDAAGHCLPIWAEGIRSTIHYSTICGQLIAKALDGHIAASEARELYVSEVARSDSFHRLLLAVHNVTAWLPERGRAGILQAIQRVNLAGPFIRVYLRGSGGPAAPSSWGPELPDARSHPTRLLTRPKPGRRLMVRATGGTDDGKI